MWVHELQEILGERACVVHELSKVQLKCGPRSAARQQFLVRGSFLMDVEDGDEEEDDTPEPNTYWVHKADLLKINCGRGRRGGFGGSPGGCDGRSAPGKEEPQVGAGLALDMSGHVWT